MANIFDVARYILEQNDRMSPMKLQKLCYYSQAWSIVWENEPLFDEQFYAWPTGPLCMELFDQTQGKYSVVASDEPGDSLNLTDRQKSTIDKVLHHYGDRDAFWLSYHTRMENPWIHARKSTADETNNDVVITKESMAEYYDKHKLRIKLF